MSRSCLKSAGNSSALLRNKLCAAVLMALAGPAYALPQGGQVVAGDASIAVSGDTMDIHQDSQRAILNFHSFDIAQQQTVNFHQPGADAVALNRVLGDRLSEIHGAINANGQVYLINPNGVVFGNGAEINVGSLVVTTLDMTDQDFLAGRDAFSGTTDGRVENNGQINAEGRVVLLAPEVVNRGEIHVPDGDIRLQASRQALLHTPGSEIPILLDDPDLVGRVTNEGTLRAGEIALVLDGAGRGNVYDSAINNSGLVRAAHASGEGGAIHLLAATGVVNSGTLDASAEQGHGGSVSIVAEAINQSGHITATSKGTGDGGDIDLLASNAIAMHSGSTIDASADQQGDAGDVVVIAEKATWLTKDAAIKARGGKELGDGGFVEVSGREFVSVYGDVDVGATAGEGGLWFIDPTDIHINNEPGQDFGGGFIGSDPTNWTPDNPAPASALINVVSLRNALNNEGNVRISTASSGAGVGNITFDAVLDYNGLGATRTLTLVADNQIIFTANGGIWDSNPGTADGVNFFATAAAGFSIVDGAGSGDGSGVINAGTGKIDITVTTGDALITGLASAAAAHDAIRLRVLDGQILNNGETLWDFKTLNVDGGVVLSASDGIDEVALDVNYLHAESSAGGINLYAGNESGDVSSTVFVNHLSAADSAVLHTDRQLWVADSAFLANAQLSSTVILALPESGVTATGALTLLGPDIVTYNAEGYGGRTLTLGATDLVINTSAAGGNLQINSSVDTLSLTNLFTNTITVTDTDDLVVANLVTSGNAIISTGNDGDLSVGDIHIGANGIGFDFDAGGTLTHTGTLTSDAGADNITFGFNSAAALNLTGSLRDSNNTNNSTHNYTFNAGTDFVMAAGALVGAGDGEIVINANNGSATVTGLSTQRNAQDAVRITALSGSIVDANPAQLDIHVPDGGFLLHAEGDIGELSVESNFMDVVSATGDITIHEHMSTSVLRLETPGTATITTGGQFSVDLAASFQATNLLVDAGGDFRIANSGFTIAGDLTVIAETIRGEAGSVGSGTVGTPVMLSATNADITLRNGAVSRVWQTTFDQLALNIAAGAGSFSLDDADGLTLAGLTTGGDASFTTNNANLVLTSSPEVAGSLSLRTLGAGDLVIPETGLDHSAALTVDVENIVDSDSNVILGAAGANITLRDGTAAQSWSTRFDQLTLEIAGGGDFSLVDEDGLTLNAVATGGSVSFTTTGADLLVTSAPLIGGNLTLATDTSGDVVIPDGGLSYTGDLTVVADNLVDSNAALNLTAANADITLRDGTPARSWTTNFAQLALNIGSGTGSFALVDDDGLTLNAVTTGGNASFTTTNADLVLTDSPTVTGNLSLIANGSGDVVIPDSGLLHTGNLTVTADNLRDSDSAMTLGATNADISLRDGGVAQTWTTRFDQLTLDIAGTGDFALVDTDGVTLNSINTGGSAAFTTTAADLVLNSNPVVAGDLALTTENSGDVIIADTGLTHSGDLTIEADNLLSGGATITLAAANADITLRGGDLPQSWSTSLDSLVLDMTGTGDFLLTDTDGLTLTSAITGGNASFRTTNADLVVAATPSVAGELGLSTLGAGDVVIPDDGLNHSGNLSIQADNLLSGSSTITLAAADASITLRGGDVAQSWTTAFDALVLDIAGAGDFLLTDSDGLTLDSVTTGGNAAFRTTGAGLVVGAPLGVAGELNLVALGSGDVVIPAAGLVHSGDLTIEADDLIDSDTDVTLAAANANITLRNGGTQARTWATSFDQLILDIAGTGDFSLTDTDALTLTSVTTGGNASFTTSDGDLTLSAGTMGGNAAFTATDGNVVLTNAPTIVGDLSLTTVGSGDVVLPNTGIDIGGDLTVDADDLRDSNANLTLAATNANIILRNGGTQARTWATSFDQLILDIAGTGDFSLTDTDALTLTSVTTGGNASFTTSDGDLTLSAGTMGGNAAFTATDGNVVLTNAPTIAGDLSLTTVGSGDVVLPNAGIDIGGDLTVDADDLRDSNANLTLAATNANIILRNGGTQARAWATAFDQLVLDIAGTGDFSLTNADALTLTSVTTGGNASFTTSDGDLTLSAGTMGGNAAFTATDGNVVLTNAPTIAGDLSLTTVGSGDVVLPNTGIDIGGDLRVDADDLRDSNANLTLAATNANIILRNGGTQARTWATSFDQLILDIAGTGDFSLTNADALTLTSVTTGGNASFTTSDGDLTLSAGTMGGNAAFTATDGNVVLTNAPTIAGDLSLTTVGSGDVLLPNTGIDIGGDLTVDADDLRDSNANLTLAATNANIILRNGGTQARAWATAFDQLVLDIAGTGDFSLTNADALTLTSVTTGGNASFTTTEGDLIFIDVPVVSGDLTLVTSGLADVVIPDTGLLHGGNLTIDATNLRDADFDLILEAATADIRLRDGASAQSWATNFDNLILSIAGGGALSVTDIDGLILESVAVGGDASFSSTNADLVVASAPVVAGDLSLITRGTGDLIIPQVGLEHSGDLSLNADQVISGDAAIRLSAAGVSATLRDQQQATNWQTSVERLALNLAGGGAVDLTNTGTLMVENVVSDGVVNVSTAGDLQIGSLSGTDMGFSGADIALLQSNYGISGELSLSATNQLQLTATGLTVPGTLSLSAANLSASGGGPVRLAAEAADLILTGDQALALTTQLSQLGLTYNGGTLSIDNDRNLVLPRFDVPNLANLSLAVNGTLTVPSAGVAASQRINIDAVDLLDGDRSLTLSAPELAVRLSSAGGDHNWTVNADVLDVLLRGQANLSVSATDGLRLADLNGDAQAVLVENGNFSLSLDSGDLTLAGNVSAADLSADGRRAGVIDLTVARGSVYTSGPVTLLSRNTLDQTAGTAADRYGIRIRLTDTEATERTITLGDTSGSATLRAIGGDVLLDTRPDATAAEATRTLVHTSNSIIEVYNNLGDAPSGQVLVNGEPATAQPWQTVRANRLLAIVTDVPAQDTGDILDELDDLDGSTDIVKDVDKSGPQAASQFDQVFGTCDELDQKNQHRCRVDAALKAFLSHWLVGGEMPPKTEIR